MAPLSPLVCAARGAAQLCLLTSVSSPVTPGSATKRSFFSRSEFSPQSSAWSSPCLQSMEAQLCCAVLSHSAVPDSATPMDCSPPGSSVHEILQARKLERVAFPPPGNLPNSGIEPRSPTLQVDSLPAGPPGKPQIQLEDGWTPVLQWSPLSTQMRLSVLTRVRLFATQWTVACQAPLSMRFCRQEYWSGLPFLLQGNLPDPGTEPSVS